MNIACFINSHIKWYVLYLHLSYWWFTVATVDKLHGSGLWHRVPPLSVCLCLSHLDLNAVLPSFP